MNSRIFGMGLLLLLAGCAKEEAASGPETTASAEAAPAQATESSGVAVPDEEPSEEVLRKLDFQRYADIEKMGGMPVVSTASGKGITLHPKLYEVHKDDCKRVPQSPPGHYECGLTIKVSLSPDGSDPSEQGERILVKWDPKGEWVLQ